MATRKPGTTRKRAAPPREPVERPNSGRALDQPVVIRNIQVDKIVPSPDNPRRRMRNIAELAESIRTYGFLQPVVVWRIKGRYKLIAGHRRLQGAKSLGLTTIPAVVRNKYAEDAYVLTLVENLQRERLSPREEAAALATLMQERDWSIRQVSEKIGRSHVYVSKRLRVFEDDVLGAPVLSGKLPVSTAEELLRAPQEARAELAARAVEEHWERNQVRAEVQKWKAAFHSEPSTDSRSELVLALTQQLLQTLEDGPITDLSTEARASLTTLATDLSFGRFSSRARLQQRLNPAEKTPSEASPDQG